jgi:HAD superfamily hydrolase (TIGR01509 family)
MSQPTLFLTVGLPGTGKTTAARRIEAEHGALRLTKDEWVKALYGQHNPASVSDIIEGRLIQIAMRALELGVSVVLDFGLWSRDERSALRQAAADVGAAVVICYFELTPEEQRRRAEDVLLRHEDQAAARSTLNAGCRALLDWLREQAIRTALITRNSRRSADAVLARHGLVLDVLITREDGRFKPDPHPLLEACRRLGLDPAQAWMVGDGQYDVEAGLAAGVHTVWISHGRPRPFTAEPSVIVRDLPQLLGMLKAPLGS